MAYDSVDFRTLVLAGSSTSIDRDPEGVKVKMFPNPTTGLVALEIEGLKPGKIELDLRHVTGQEIMRETVSLSGTSLQKQIDLSGLASGIYLIRVKNEENIIIRKLIKQ